MINISTIALRRLFQRGVGRSRMTTTLTLYADNLLRKMGKVGKGGEGGPLISLAIELFAYAFDVHDDPETLAEQLHSLNEDEAYKLAERFDLLSQWIQTVDALGEREKEKEATVKALPDPGPGEPPGRTPTDEARL